MNLPRSLAVLQSDLRAGNLSVTDLVTHYLEQIRAGRFLNCFLEVFSEEILDQAIRLDQKIRQGQAARLAGLVVGIKDLLCYKNHTSQAGSRILEGFTSSYTATAVQKLIDQDTLIIGRNNCDEFGMGSTNENSFAGPVRNPLDTNLVPGGSSGGSAAAVKAGFCHVAIGSDTGGSVRQPAAFCDVIGLKPTYSRISRFGLIAYASSFDTIGIIAQNIADTALVLETMAGKDEFDSTASTREVPAYTHYAFDGKLKKIALFNEVIEHPALHTDIRRNMIETTDKLKKEGHKVDIIDFPLLDYILPAYYILTTAEASSNLSRFDGVKYGFRAENCDSLDELYKNTRTEGFGKEVLRRITLGTFVLSASYYDTYYIKAQKVRRRIKEKINEVFSSYDFIILPTTPAPPYQLGEINKNPLEMYLADLFTVLASIDGNPAISIPSGKTENGLPIGIQIIADDFNEMNLLSFSDYILNLDR